MRIETRLAKASKARVELRDPYANYNKMTVAASQQADSRTWVCHAAGYQTSCGARQRSDCGPARFPQGSQRPDEGRRHWPT